MEKMWLKDAQDNIDLYVAFRGTFYTESAQEAELRLSGCSWFRAYINGALLSEGPYRNDEAHSEYEVVKCAVNKGKNVIYAVVHSIGIPTRMTMNREPFFSCVAEEFKIQWKCRHLDAYESKIRRINPQLGWIESCRTERLPEYMREIEFDDTDWGIPDVKDDTAVCTRVAEASVKHIKLDAPCIAAGTLSQRFGYEYDDIPVAFYMRSLINKNDSAPDGIWRRYDLKKTCLFYFEAEVTAPAGTIMEIAYAETLTDERVAPFITLSAGNSCNLDRYILKGGRQKIGNITPKGGRYAEIHLIGDTDAIELHSCRFIQRTYFDTIRGAFTCDDELINKIWLTGAVTLQSCAEDAIIDNPTRERGEWTGDAVSAPLNIIAAAYGDFGLIKRALKHSAYCASPDGCIAGMSPGGTIYVSTYALQWVTGCYAYFTNTGDREFLAEMYPYAKSNLDYFFSHFKKYIGLDGDIYWAFVDWGYDPGSGISESAVNFYLLQAVKTMMLWSKLMENEADFRLYRSWKNKVEQMLPNWFCDQKKGLHLTALALMTGKLGSKEEAIQSIKQHYENCFPNKKDAPRLSSPDRNCPQLITPYYSHFIFPLLFENREGSFVVEQYKSCWGWMLSQEDGTWLEVFDTHWSHCHEWSGCPTWQLSTYILGLSRRFDIEENCFAYCAVSTSIKNAKGIIPASGGNIHVELVDGKYIRISPDVDITILHKRTKTKILAGKSMGFHYFNERRVIHYKTLQQS